MHYCLKCSHSAMMMEPEIYPKCPRLKITVLWDVPTCSLVGRYQCFGGACCHSQVYPEDGGSRFFWNIGTCLPKHTVLHPRRLLVAPYSSVHACSTDMKRGNHTSKCWLLSLQKLYYPLSYRVPVRERYGSTLLPATREQHDQNCTQSHYQGT